MNTVLILVLYKHLSNKKPKIGDVITANVYRYLWELPRKFAIPMIPLGIWFSIEDLRPSYGLAYVVTMYFLAVDDLPSQPSKLRVWLESLFTPDPLPSEGSARTQNG